MSDTDGTAGAAAIGKFDQWFAGLEPAERAVIGGMVRCALLHVAEVAASVDPTTASSGESGFSLPPFVGGLTEQNAPNLATALAPEVGGYGGQFNFGGQFGGGQFGGQFGGGQFGGQFGTTGGQFNSGAGQFNFGGGQFGGQFGGGQFGTTNQPQS